MADIAYALSIKQPWAALLVHGRKTIEIRSWPTARRGPILIHAGRTADERPEAWAHVPPELLPTTRLRGGIIGSGELMNCLTYRDLASFAVDQGRHLNDLDWFTEPCLYGFVFSDLRTLPFRPFPGWFRFFEVPLK